MVLSMDRWVGKVAVVTGASSGIGAAIAERLVGEGLKVAALARRQVRLQVLANKLIGKKGKLYPIKADITKEEDILEAFKWVKDNLGPVHILVNNAGIVKFGISLTDGDAESWRDVFNVNVLGLCIATREAVRDMKANSTDGHVIQINSIVGHSVPNFPGMNVYPASKYAVTALAETLRLELNSSKSKIKISSISPGPVLTEILPDELKKIFNASAKTNNILDAEDIADSTIYVLSTPPHVQVIAQNVAALARRQVRLQVLANKLIDKKGKLYPIKADITKEEDILEAFKWVKDNLGPVHILVNNAGIVKFGISLTDGDAESWRDVFNVNVLGLCIATREAVRDMKANSTDGHVIQINSIVGHSVPNFPGMNVYPASKYAVTALAETLRLELNSSKSKIKISSISPGPVLTEILPDELKKIFNASAKTNNILDAEDIADSTIYVLSTPPHVQSPYVTYLLKVFGKFRFDVVTVQRLMGHIQELTIRPVVENFN
ncbi:hypothetical protein NQ317_015396 [Molorchus minor]|uniref:Uncharacterized protein n=1 Tax=Molorchus minor TaxID=1323400 RepID=A0ABQ9IT84_9CUCU|nr:hypothetical protein NQ317_015396 [Molorchus minor]